MAATYTIKQVASILGYSTKTIYPFLEKNQVQGVKTASGAFRIPQSELDRLLFVTIGNDKKQKHVVSSPSIELDSVMGIPVRIVLPNIFHWFVGTAAVITGLALFLFNNSFASVQTSGFLPVIAGARVVLIGAGLGLLFTDIIDGAYLVWRRVFQCILGALGLFMGAMLLRTGDLDGGVTYLFMGLTLVISVVTGASGIAILLVYGSFLGISLPFLLFFGSGDAHIAYILNLLQMTPSVAAGIAGSAVVIYLVGIWIGYFKYRPLYFALSWVGASVAIALAFLFAHQNYWSRSFFFLTLGMASFFSPIWGNLSTVVNRKAQFLIHCIFFSMFILLLFSVWGVHWMQVYAIGQTKNTLVNTLAVGKEFIEDALSDVKATVTASVSSQEFVKAVETKDIAAITSLSRVIYESNHDIRRVLIFDAKGDGILLYPFGTFDVQNYAFRDYFKQAKVSSAPYVSDVFEGLADQSHRRVVTISAPFINREGKFVGVFVASLNIDALGLQLQKFAKDTKGEYFLVVDSTGKRIIHPDFALIGKTVDPTDLTPTGAEGKVGMGTGYTFDGTEALYAYGGINSLHWGLSVKTPISDALVFTDQANIAIFTTFMVSVLVVCCFLIVLRQYISGRRQGGSRLGGSP